MTTSPPPPDVGAVLAALREEVRARRQAEQPDPAASALDRQLARCAEQLEITRVVSAHWPLESRTPLARAQNLVNKVVRRALRWYINPIVEQQNAFNDVAARTLRLLVDAYGEVERREAGGVRREAGGEDDQTKQAPIPNLQSPMLQQAVGELAAAEPPAPLADLELPQLALALADRAPVHAHWDLGRGPGPAVQRLVRRYLRWLINPIVEQQNAFNAALAAFLPPLVRLDADRRARVATERWQNSLRSRETRREGEGETAHQ